MRIHLPTRSDLRVFGVMAGTQLVLYFIFSVNARALAQARVCWTFGSDLLFGYVQYNMLKRVAKNEDSWGTAGYVLGGAFGSVFAIYLTRWLFGQ